MAAREAPLGASEQDKLILKYLREKVDPIFVPMMRSLIQQVIALLQGDFTCTVISTPMDFPKGS